MQMQRGVMKQLCCTGQKMPTVPTLSVRVACVLSTIFLLLSQKTFASLYLPSFLALIVMSPSFMKWSCLYPVPSVSFCSCTLLSVQSEYILKGVCISATIFCAPVFQFSQGSLFPGLKIWQGCNFHSHCEPFAFFLTGTGYINTSYGWEILVTLTVLLAVLSIATTALLLWKRKASNNQTKSNT